MGRSIGSVCKTGLATLTTDVLIVGGFFVRGMGMKIKDLLEFSHVCSVYSMCFGLNDLLSQMEVDEFPDELHECIDNLKTSTTHVVKFLDDYIDQTEEKFFPQCEDYKQYCEALDGYEH